MGVLRLRKWRWMAIALFLLCLVFLLLSNEDVANYFYNDVFPVRVSKEARQIECYDYTGNELQELSDSEVRKSSSMFFVETRCHLNGINITAREGCAMESVAKMNPNSDVFLLIPSAVKNVSPSLLPHLQQLLTYPNVKIRHVNVNTYFEGTPLGQWFKEGHLKSSKWPQSHASDLLRYTTLWKFGGTYMDLDIVAMRSFENMTNFAGAESSEDVAAGFLSFSHGSRIASISVNDLRKRFRGYDWGYNGPGVITRSLVKLCGLQKIPDMTPDKCDGFSVLKPFAFYAIRWRNWKAFFDEASSERVMREIKDSYAIHVWNQLSKEGVVKVGSKQPYGLVAAKFCPKTYLSAGSEF